MTLHVNGEWSGWDGETIVELTDGSFWQQTEYLYEYRYSFRPEADLTNGHLQVAGMSRAVRVQRVSPTRSNVDGAWQGWTGTTELGLIDGSRWKQAEYHYEYLYAFRPSVLLLDGKILVEGMSKPIRVRRLTA